MPKFGRLQPASLSHSHSKCMFFFFFSCTSLQVYYPYSILVFLQPSQSAEIANGFLGPGFMLHSFFVFLSFLCAFKIPSV
ncbi:hypothetical protein BO99DRAFT_222773 [Aspergillus violaceofuscus CBS 115571]|uniref:Uncharacterized protein n=1 Tax=Aspergillus violaceofuscus (strain CBS 115571) TaxID=1450538 RepID=A0A2V5HF97_ASPV1|nr:hypothetical protein BO99DRAFT_222773 [Aspergillus violaceofuscus CBS 115571]